MKKLILLLVALFTAAAVQAETWPIHWRSMSPVDTGYYILEKNGVDGPVSWLTNAQQTVHDTDVTINPDTIYTFTYYMLFTGKTDTGSVSVSMAGPGVATDMLQKADSAEYMNVKSMGGSANNGAPTNINAWYDNWVVDTVTASATAEYFLMNGGLARHENNVVVFTSDSEIYTRRIKRVGYRPFGEPDTFYVDPPFISGSLPSDFF